MNFEALKGFHDPCFVLAENGTILKLNEAALQFFPSSNSKITGEKFSKILAPTSVLRFEDALFASIKNNTSAEFEISMQSFDANIYDVNIYISPFINEMDGGKNVLIVGKDFTSEKKKESEFLRFYSVAQNTVNPLQITDLNGKMNYVNPAFERASGYKKDELIGQNPNIFGSKKHSKEYWEAMWRTISSGKVWLGEVENKKKSGESFHTRLLVSPIIDETQKVVGYFGVHHDLTDKKILEKQLIHTQKMESIGTLAAGVAHEVGNPLASISALVQIVQRETDDNFIKEKLELVKKQITRISKIIRDLVDFSRPSDYELKSTDINDNLKEAIEIVKVGKKTKDINFISHLDESLPSVPLIADQVQQVFVNILINAVDAIAEKKEKYIIEEESFIKVSTSIKDATIKVIFDDNGIGIPEQSLSKVFEPFFTTKKEGKGTGLGLWVSYGIIKSSHGEIKVESSYKKGTKFIINFPLNLIL
ncbi:MAG: PAS domain S-box protein [Ignavibacteriaceae bacterium]|nr:PAS domain S-box protein [Ignavibacteriaceae bacterium]